MLRGLCVRSRVAVRRVIATADVTASKTDAQTQPLAADAQAVLAALDGGRHASNQDLIKMGADVIHRAPSLTVVFSGRARTRGHCHSPTAVTHRLVDAGVRREEVRHR